MIAIRHAEEGDYAYLQSCSQRAIAWTYGPAVHAPTVYRLVADLVDRLIAARAIAVVTLADAPQDILGFVARGRDGISVELIYLRRGLEDTPHLLAEVVHALVPGRLVVLLRPQNRRVMLAMQSVGMALSIIPLAV